MKWIFLVLLLTGCSLLSPQQEQQTQAAVQEAVQEIQQTPQVQEVVEEIQQTPQIQEVVQAVLDPTVIVAYGDSLTAGPGVGNNTYPAHLERLLRDKGYDVTVINEGVSGETSNGAVARIDDILAHEPDIVIVETGVNDILQGVPAEQTYANIDAIIKELQANDVTVVLAGMEAFGEFQGYSVQIRTMYPTLAQENDVPFIPFFLAGVAGNAQLNLPDYVHPNGAGYAVIAEQNVLPVLEPLLENTKRI